MKQVISDYLDIPEFLSLKKKIYDISKTNKIYKAKEILYYFYKNPQKINEEHKFLRTINGYLTIFQI